MIVRGVDVSSGQPPGKCNWPVAYGSGIRFAFVKGSEGMEDERPFVSPAARDHIANIRRTPILIGMTHEARPDNRFKERGDGYENGLLEAKFAAKTAIDLGLAWSGSLPVVVALEKYVPTSLETTVEQRDAFARGLVLGVQTALGRWPIVYTGEDYWRRQHSPALALELRERGCLLWQVDYKESAPDPGEAIAGWPWSWWQHSGGGKFAFASPVPGLPSPIDQNIYRGSLTELRGLAA